MQNLNADMAREIAAVEQQAIALRARIIYLEALQTKASLEPALQNQLDHLRQLFESTKATLSAMEARNKNLIERMSKAILKPTSKLTDSDDDLITCIPRPEFRKIHQPFNTP
jgi:oligoendopeptidase F